MGMRFVEPLPKRQGKPVVLYAIACAMAVFFLVAGGCYCAVHTVYSDGYRDGIVRKFSDKGVWFKTYEGELALDGAGGAIGKWDFTVSDTAVIEELKNIPPGQRVRLHYKQYFVTMPFSGDTDYRVTKVERVK